MVELLQKSKSLLHCQRSRRVHENVLHRLREKHKNWKTHFDEKPLHTHLRKFLRIQAYKRVPKWELLEHMVRLLRGGVAIHMSPPPHTHARTYTHACTHPDTNTCRHARTHKQQTNKQNAHTYTSKHNKHTDANTHAHYTHKRARAATGEATCRHTQAHALHLLRHPLRSIWLRNKYRVRIDSLVLSQLGRQLRRRHIVAALGVARQCEPLCQASARAPRTRFASLSRNTK